MALGYDEIVSCLRSSLEGAQRNARAFEVRANGRPELLSSHAWRELAQIERVLAARLDEVIRRELHAEPSSTLSPLRVFLGGSLDALRGERALLSSLAQRTARHPVETWRSGAPQLERSLWPFFSARTRYLANTLALALDERAPWPPLVWNPSRRSFS